MLIYVDISHYNITIFPGYSHVPISLLLNQPHLPGTPRRLHRSRRTSPPAQGPRPAGMDFIGWTKFTMEKCWFNHGLMGKNMAYSY